MKSVFAHITLQESGNWAEEVLQRSAIGRLYLDLRGYACLQLQIAGITQRFGCNPDVSNVVETIVCLVFEPVCRKATDFAGLRSV
jgi:hypothetical protein